MNEATSKNEALCLGRSGRLALIEHAYCPEGCFPAFETITLHSHSEESGEKVHRIPAVVDIECFKIAEPAGCPTCGASVLVAMVPIP